MGTKRYTLIDGVWVPWQTGTSTPVTPPNRTMQVGVDPSKNGDESATTWYDEIRRVATTLDIDPNSRLPLGNHAKFFDGVNGLRTAANNYDNAGYDGKPVLCHKQDNTTDYNWRLDRITKPEIWVYWQERGFNKGPSVAVYQAAYNHMDAARRNHPNGHLVELCMDGASYQEGKQRQWDQMDPAAAHVEYVGLDCYRRGWQPPQDPEDLFVEAYAWHQAIVGTYAAYKGWVIPEFGCARRDSNGVLLDPDTRRAEIEADFDWAEAHGCVWINYWEENNTSKEGVDSDWRCAPDPPCKDLLVSRITREELN